MSAKFCAYCGTPFPKENAKFCAKCGRPAPGAAAPTAGPAVTSGGRSPREHTPRAPKPVRRPKKGLAALFAVLTFFLLTLLLLVQSIRQGLSTDRVRSAVNSMDIGSLPLGGLLPGVPADTPLSDGLEEMFTDLPASVRDYYDLDSSSINDALSSQKVRDWFSSHTADYLNAVLYDEGDGRITDKDLLNLFNAIGKDLGIPNLGDEYIVITDDDKEGLKDYYVKNSFSNAELLLIRLLFAPWFSILLIVLIVIMLILTICFACGRFLRSLIAPGLAFLSSGVLTVIAVIVSAFVLPEAIGSAAASAGESVTVAAKHLLGGVGFFGILYGGISVVLGVLCIILFVASGKKNRG